MESLVLQFFMSMLRTFFRAKSFHQINKSSNIFAAETLYKNCNISRWYALVGNFSRRTTNCLGSVDISASEPGVFNQHSEVNTGSTINFGVCSSITGFTEYYTKPGTRESGKDKNPIHRAFTEVTSMGQGTKKIDRAVIFHISSSTSPVQGFTTPENSGNDFQIFSRGIIESQNRQG